MQRIGTMAIAAVMALSRLASAVTINFDSSNYSSDPTNPAGGTSVSTVVGSGRTLNGQGKLVTTTNASWSSTSAFAVVAGAGTGGSTGIVTSSTVTGNPTHSYIPTAAEWNNESFNVGSSIMNFSFDVKLASHINSTTSTATSSAITRIWIGYQASSQAAVELYILGSGNLAIGTAQTSIKTNAFDDGADDIDINNGWHTISGRIDHGTNTYTLLFDDQQIDLDGNAGNGMTLTRAMDRGAADDFTGFGGFALNNRVDGANGAVAVDNIVMTVPEPATAGVLLCGVFALLRRRNRCS